MKTPMEDAPRRWYAEAQAPGRPAHRFETYNEEAARALCDALGWDFLRAWQEGGHSDRPAQPAPLPGRGRKVSPKQLKALICEARKTYEFTAHVLGGGLPLFDEWRRHQLSLCVGLRSFRAIPAGAYEKVLQHFMRLRGVEPAAGRAHGGERQTGEAGDTLHDRKVMVYLLERELKEHAKRAAGNARCAEKGVLGVGYLLSIAQDKNRGHTLADLDDLLKLPVSRLEQLLYTLQRRIRRREGGKEKPES